MDICKLHPVEFTEYQLDNFIRLINYNLDANAYINPSGNNVTHTTKLAKTAPARHNLYNNAKSVEARRVAAFLADRGIW